MQERCNSECKGCFLCRKESTAKVKINDAFLRKTIYSKGSHIYTNILSECRPIADSFEKPFPTATSSGPLFSAPAYSLWEPKQKTLNSTAQKGYNPLFSTTYDTSRFSQLKSTCILSSTILPILEGIDSQSAQHTRLNEVLGLPAVHNQYVRLTKEVLCKVISCGGLKEVDDKALWEYISKEIGHYAEDFSKLRMYYIIVCYPYEQVLQIKKSNEAAAHSIIVVYIEPKKGDIYPEIVRSLAKRKKKEAAQYVQPMETSGPAEIVYTLNHFFSKGVQKKEDLEYLIKKIASFSCSDSEVGALYSCKEILFIHEQLHKVLVQWIQKHIEDLVCKDSFSWEAIKQCHEYFAQIIDGGASLCSKCFPLSLDSFFLDTLSFFVKSTSIFLEKDTVAVFSSLVERLSKEQLSISGRYGQKILIIMWNILRSEKDAETMKEIRRFTEEERFSDILKETLLFLQSPILSRGDLESFLKNGQLESTLLVLSLVENHFAVQVPTKRFAQIWRHLLVYVSQRKSTAAGPVHMHDSAASCLDILSLVLYKYLQKSTDTHEKKKVLDVFDVEDGSWIESSFSEGLPSSVHPLCTLIFLGISGSA